jgi:hypothetical protein
MAKYNVTYACGHEGTVQLIGKTSERDRKLAWLATVDCPACARTKKLAAAQADETPVTIHIKSTSHNVAGYSMHLIAVAQGGTYREKENLKTLGFTFGAPQFDTGVFSLLSTKRPESVWSKVIEVRPADFDDVASLCKACGVIEGKIGNYEATLDIQPIDLALLRKGIEKAEAEASEKAAQEAKDAERKAKIGSSALDIWIAQNHAGKKWNGKVYGTDKYGYSIYLDGKETKIPAAIMDAQKEWRAHRDAVNAEYGITK